jgi:hypothetical protein
MITVLEPCCKQTQFENILKKLERTGEENFIYYGDVTMLDWMRIMLVYNRNAKAVVVLKKLNEKTLSYICERMRENAFMMGRPSAKMMEKVHIFTAEMPELTNKAKELMEEGLLTVNRIKGLKREIFAMDNGIKKYTVEGDFFAEKNNMKREAKIKNGADLDGMIFNLYKKVEQLKETENEKS